MVGLMSTYLVEELFRGLTLPGLRMSLSERSPGMSKSVPLAVGVLGGSPEVARSMRAASCDTQTRVIGGSRRT